MKQLLLVVMFFTFIFPVSGQGVFTNSTTATIETVIQDVSTGYANIKGDLISKTGTQSEYKSKVQLPGALSSIVIQNKWIGKDVLSWRAILYSGNNFAEASEKFRETFKDLNNTIVKSGSEKPYILSGNFEEPALSQSTNLILMLLPAKGDLQNVRVELSLQNKQGWIVMLRVFDKRYK